MRNTTITKVPEEFELIEFFESESIDSAPSDGYWCYEFTDKNGVTLQLTFNIFESYVQTSFFLNNNPIDVVRCENITHLIIEHDCLRGEFCNREMDLRLELRLRPRIKVIWSLLKVR
jgi:hypothetical protein